MGIISEGIMVCDENGLCFGNYLVKEKLKIEGFEFSGDIYKVKTHDQITRLEKNGRLLLETVPGASIHNFAISEKKVSFLAEGYYNTQITLELEPETEYTVFIDGFNTGKMKTNLSGKTSFSVELNEKMQEVKIKKLV